MKIKLSNQEIDQIYISNLLSQVTDNIERKEVARKSGEQHYRLLVYLSSLFNDSLICDIGTFKGSSALALSQNLSNKIVSFGIEERIVPVSETIKYLPQEITFHRPTNVDFISTNNFLNYFHIILQSSLIFLDIDHEGKKEKELYDLLVEYKYKGIMVLDDIHIYKIFQSEKSKLKGMEDFWNSIKDKVNVFDISKYGHGPVEKPTGTGLIIFNNETELVLE